MIECAGSGELEAENLKLGEMVVREVYELDVYRLAEQLSDMVWDAFDTWSVKTQKTMGYQVIRSADSIAANIAEGYGRFTPPDRRKFYIYSRGSFEETKAWLRKAVRRKVITSKDEIEVFKAVINELGPKLNAFINKTNNAAVREHGSEYQVSSFEFPISPSETQFPVSSFDFPERSDTHA